MEFVPEKVIKDYNETVYLILSKIIGVKFKREIQNSGVVFEGIFKMDDLVANEQSYLLVLKDKSIRFSSKDEFVEEFIIYLNANIRKLNQDYKELRRRESEDAIVDEFRIFLEDETIGMQGQKHLSLLKKFREVRKELPNINS